MKMFKSLISVSHGPYHLLIWLPLILYELFYLGIKLSLKNV